ncbi:MAG: hypothetical protein WC628_06940 [Candidatus Omnitrophota bacterium]
MSEDIKSLIAKINAEGIKSAEEKAAVIQAQAQKQAAELLAQAKIDAELMLRQAEERIAGLEEKTRALLAQAARDVLLGLRKEINLTLGRIVAQDVREALSPELLEKILHDLILKTAHSAQVETVVLVSPHDFDLLARGTLGKLKNELKKGLVLRPSEAIHAGFSISFDAGKSQFDFTDQALAEYISANLKPNLKQVLEDATS